jgi:hypothetical protein
MRHEARNKSGGKMNPPVFSEQKPFLFYKKAAFPKFKTIQSSRGEVLPDPLKQSVP